MRESPRSWVSAFRKTGGEQDAPRVEATTLSGAPGAAAKLSERLRETAADRGLLSSSDGPSSLSLGVPVWAMVWVGSRVNGGFFCALCLSGSGHFQMNTLRICRFQGPHPTEPSLCALSRGAAFSPGPSWLGVRR